MKRKKAGEVVKKSKPKKKVLSTSGGDEFGLSGTETANELYTLYIRASMGTNQKSIELIRNKWKAKYYEEKKNGKEK
jgi:hypothetical protein